MATDIIKVPKRIEGLYLCTSERAAAFDATAKNCSLAEAEAPERSAGHSFSKAAYKQKSQHTLNGYQRLQVLPHLSRKQPFPQHVRRLQLQGTHLKAPAIKYMAF